MKSCLKQLGCGLGIIFAVFLACAVWFETRPSPYGQPLNYGPCTLYVTDGVTLEEGKRVGSALVVAGWFKDRETGAQIRRLNGRYELRLPMKSSAWFEDHSY